MAVTGEAAAIALPGYGARGTLVVDHRHGARVVVQVPLNNDGPLPLHVSGIALSQDQALPLLEAAADLDVWLAPGATRVLAVPGVLGNCAWYHERELQLYESVRVHGSVLGRPVQRTAALAVPVLVRSPMVVGCPDRKLDRQARDRSRR